ncbi:5-deoxy-glucuronate isomerase [Rathayibacter festucae]|uniref:5-deoxy-glucuronate isomerase n=2 Tax=Rathayibacter festucae TaxID=110937 RepID=A0A3Q9UWW2_9MICO|nr:5-deoxy-glucuronate isomerase [Rathayibacter festucae]AZZ51721.1 5-deoxy-glucuronate isomerase [Rathayibacter festucae DSM 15932]MCJ1700260.1 5-deoxy-glucuronate isomerase [Rathayibacter festucae]QHC62899.1 5-deoxy-glucuronate isomerase [Rathayibacter festucae]
MTTQNEWVFPKGTLPRDGWESVVDGGVPGWQHTGLRVADLAPGDELALPAEGVERLVVPLSGSFTVRHQSSGPSETTLLEGRASVFDGPSDVLYLSSLASATLEGQGRVAVAEAPADDVHPSRHILRSEVPVELRGAGRSSRQVHNFGTPQALAAGRFIVCEVITPAENWSSYPPHKHDELIPGQESRLEEIYYFETAVSKGLDAPAQADPFGFLRTYSSPAGEIDVLAEVRTGDIALLPYGWHGPCVAAPGYDLYYLNVMAGPDPDRVWNISDDPAHGWIRATWDGQDIDPRLPYGPDTSR